MTTIQASNFVISTINDFAIEAVKRGMINNEADMASFVDATANYLNVPGEVVMQVVVKIADKIKKQEKDKSKNFTFETVSPYYAQAQ